MLFNILFIEVSKKTVVVICIIQTDHVLLICHKIYSSPLHLCSLLMMLTDVDSLLSFELFIFPGVVILFIGLLNVQMINLPTDFSTSTVYVSMNPIMHIYYNYIFLYRFPDLHVLMLSFLPLLYKHTIFIILPQGYGCQFRLT